MGGGGSSITFIQESPSFSCSAGCSFWAMASHLVITLKKCQTLKFEKKPGLGHGMGCIGPRGCIGGMYNFMYRYLTADECSASDDLQSHYMYMY